MGDQLKSTLPTRLMPRRDRDKLVSAAAAGGYAHVAVSFLTSDLTPRRQARGSRYMVVESYYVDLVVLLDDNGAPIEYIAEE